MFKKTAVVASALLLTTTFHVVIAAPASAAQKTQIIASETTEIPIGPIMQDSRPSARGPGSVPPLGGCNARMTIQVRSTYVNRILTDTQSNYAGTITCATTHPLQTMDEIGMGLELLRNLNVQKRTEPLAQCFNNLFLDPPCVALAQSDTSYCSVIDGRRCDGVYHGSIQASYLLPAGYSYRTASPGCTLLGGGRELYCKTLTSPAVVALTL